MGFRPMAKTPNPFALAALGYESWLLWVEATAVIGMRILLLMQGGPRAEKEALRMVQEKWEANMLLGLHWAGGRGARTPEAAAKHTMLHYRRRASANRRRLSRQAELPRL